ncbi:ion channel protein [Rhizoctonia solani 123E]|uniref:Ion channel protein n=1 Tax=Rhizoctonia solani 123E TaxID=1423351 RepID=A0A074RSP1_9AGAM|nr:ion channel protein [Rhizoctonia solani 123E]
MPSKILIIPIIQAIFDKRRPEPENSTRFEVARQTESGENVPTASDKEWKKPPAIWTRIKDYLWGQEDEESRREYTPNFRWTPILSGVIIPFAILLEIPGLTEHWYIRTVANKTVETQENPKILDAGLAISMASAVVANVALITRFLERRVRLSTCVAIGGLVVHDIINIIIITIFGIIHRVDDGFTYGQAFWMTVCSTIASVITTISLIYDWVRTPEFARSGSGLTRKQRLLVIIVMILLCYIALGAMCYSFIMSLSFQNGLYFTVVSIETVGFGDIILTTTLGRVFSIFYNTFGIINLGLAVSTTRETIIESFENSYRKRRVERDQLKHARAHIRAAEQLLRRMGQPVYVPLPHSLGPSETIIHQNCGIADRTRTFTAGSIGNRRRHMHAQEKLVLNVWALSREQRRALFGEGGVAGTGVGVGTIVGATGATGAGIRESPAPEELGSALEPSPNTSVQNVNSDPVTLIEQFHAELGGPGHEEENADYTELKERLESDEKKEFAVKLGVACSLFVAFWLIGSGVFVATEGWKFGESMFFCFCTFSTVGYGDFAPKTPAGRAFFVGWALFGIAAMTILISVLTEAYSSRYKTIIHSSVLDRAIKSRRQRPHSHTHRAPTQSDLDALAIELITTARAMREHMAWFVHSSGIKSAPEGIVKVLDDIAEGENMDARVKKDFMSNDEARKTVFVMSFERMLHDLACVAEEVARVPRQGSQDEIEVGDNVGDRRS